MPITSCKGLHSPSQALQRNIGVQGLSIENRSPTLCPLTRQCNCYIKKTYQVRTRYHPTVGRSGHPYSKLTNTVELVLGTQSYDMIARLTWRRASNTSSDRPHPKASTEDLLRKRMAHETSEYKSCIRGHVLSWTAAHHHQQNHHVALQ